LLGKKKKRKKEILSHPREREDLIKKIKKGFRQIPEHPGIETEHKSFSPSTITSQSLAKSTSYLAVSHSLGFKERKKISNNTLDTSYKLLVLLNKRIITWTKRNPHTKPNSSHRPTRREKKPKRRKRGGKRVKESKKTILQKILRNRD